jgi:hypothetical protein
MNHASDNTFDIHQEDSIKKLALESVEHMIKNKLNEFQMKFIDSQRLEVTKNSNDIKSFREKYKSLDELILFSFDRANDSVLDGIIKTTIESEKFKKLIHESELIIQSKCAAKDDIKHIVDGM